MRLVGVDGVDIPVDLTRIWTGGREWIEGCHFGEISGKRRGDEPAGKG
jgi:hypothetical protein